MTKPKSLFVIVNLLITMVLLSSTVGARGENDGGRDDAKKGFTSPNGQFSISVTDAGITLTGPAARIELGTATINVQAAGPVKVNGAPVQLNGACRSVAMGQGVVAVSGPGTYPVVNQVLSPSVLGC